MCPIFANLHSTLVGVRDSAHLRLLSYFISHMDTLRLLRLPWFIRPLVNWLWLATQSQDNFYDYIYWSKALFIVWPSYKELNLAKALIRELVLLDEGLFYESTYKGARLVGWVFISRTLLGKNYSNSVTMFNYMYMLWNQIHHKYTPNSKSQSTYITTKNDTNFYK